MSNDLQLRSPNFKTIKVTAASPSTYVKGLLTKVEDMVGVIVDDIVALAEGVMIYQADKIIVNKRVGTTCVFAAGDKVYYNSATNTVDIAVTSAYTLCGRALEAAGATVGTVLIELNGHIAA